MDTWKLINETGAEVAGQLSKEDFHWTSPKPVSVAWDGMKGMTRLGMPTGWTTSELIDLLKAPPLLPTALYGYVQTVNFFFMYC